MSRWETIDSNEMQKIIDKGCSNDIVIVSGEGELGRAEVYTGKRTSRAVKLRLTKERCHDDRWAKAIVYSHENEWGKVGINIESGEYCGYPKID